MASAALSAVDLYRKNLNAGLTAANAVVDAGAKPLLFEAPKPADVGPGFRAVNYGDPAKGGMQVMYGGGGTSNAIDNYLNRGFSVQEAVAAATGSTTADATSRNANTQSIVGQASARLAGVQADVLPGKTAADNALTLAQARLAGENASMVAPLARASIGESAARAFQTNTAGQLGQRELTATAGRTPSVQNYARASGISQTMLDEGWTVSADGLQWNPPRLGWLK